MVSVTLPQIIDEYRSRILEKGGFELALYEHYHNKDQSQSIDSFKYSIEKIAYRGYASQFVSEEELVDLIAKEPKKQGAGIRSNFFLLVGVCLADSAGLIKTDMSFFETLDNKSKYVASIIIGNDYCSNLQYVEGDCCIDAIRWLTDSDSSDSLDTTTISSILLKPDEAICAIDLIFLEQILLKSLAANRINLSSLNLVLQIIEEFSDSVRRITTDRYGSRQGIEIKDEYDVQDILFSILKPIFPRLQRENPLGKIGGNSSRIDLDLPEDGIMIEIKMIKESDRDHLKYVRELKQDIVNYSTGYRLKDLVFFIYDPSGRTTNKQDFLDLERFAIEQSLLYKVHSLLVR